MKYLVIGLGNLGKAIAGNLSGIGHEVIGVDKDMQTVDSMKEILSGAVALDSTDKIALNTLPLNEMDAVFITYGKDFGTSVQTVALLKSLKIEKLTARAISPIHRTVLEAIGVTEIMSPEVDFASIYASQSVLGNLFTEWYRITETHHIYKIRTPRPFIGQTLGKIQLEDNFNIRLAGIERPVEKKNLIGIKNTEYTVLEQLPDDLVIEAGDILILFGKLEVIRKLAEI